MISLDQDRVARMVVSTNSHSNSLQQLFFLVAFVLVGSFIMPSSDAQCCNIGNWEASARAFLDSDDIPGVPLMLSNSQARSSIHGAQALENRRDSFPNGKILLPLKSVASSDVVVDVSNGSDYNKSISKMPYSFLSNAS